VPAGPRQAAALPLDMPVTIALIVAANRGARFGRDQGIAAPPFTSVRLARLP